ncbi:DUF5777 family beta-barrel protein [Larkinella soli]|uniref:DUF5777 family beta-barrel protein n=1 Tax=Larkinella soli TaxID=1770527 RepID=UPI000FFBCBBC|nr:DUF5777 family beta-barrel protein [Larkinella soli]
MKSVLFLTLLIGGPVFAQDDLLSKLDGPATTRPVSATFKSTRLLNGQSVETVKAHHLDFRISHRFDRINKGAEELFGLDYATVRLGLDYGISDRFMIGVGRSSIEKNVDAYLKYKVLQQTQGARRFPFTLTAFGSVAIDTRTPNQGARFRDFQDRTFYTGQLLIARKFSERLSLQVAPTVLQPVSSTEAGTGSKVSNETRGALGVGGRFKLTKRLSVNAEYYAVTPEKNGGADRETFNPLSLGLDIETGGHVFQLIFTNSFGMIEKQFLTQTGGILGGRWEKGDIHFGFSVTRTFSFKKQSTQP